MKLLLVSQYFTPEITAAAARVHGFATGLAQRGHEVEVLCEVPSHPTGIVAPGFGGHLAERRQMDGFNVSYVWVRVTPSKATRTRLANYASFAATAALVGSFRSRPDVILASSPPLPVASVGAALAVRHRVPWVMDVRDIWPDIALVLGEVSDGPLLRAARRLEHRMYRSAAAITVTTRSFAEQISERGGGDKVTVIRNGTTATFLEAGAEAPDRHLLGDVGDRFTWTYAGNLGLAQGLESAIDAAALLGEDYHLLLVGEGPRQESLRRRAASLPEASVGFRDPVPASEAARLMRASDALLVSLTASPGLDGTVPSKLYDCCAMGRPVVVAATGEARQIGEDAGAVIGVTPESPAELADAIRRLRDDRKLAERLSERGRAMAAACERDRGVDELEGLLRSTVEARKRASD